MDGTRLIDTTGREFPQDAIVDVHISIPFNAACPIVKLSSAYISDSLISVCFTHESETNGNKSVIALSAIVSKSSFSPYTPIRLENVTGVDGAGGIVTFGDVTFNSLPEQYSFNSVIVHPCCVLAVNQPNVKRFIDNRSGDSISGDASISFSNYIVAQKSSDGISLKLKDGAAATLASECSKATGYNICGSTPVKSINGVKPDSDGNIVLWFH